MVEQKIRDKIVVRPDEVTTFYNENKKELVSPEERELDVFSLENDNLAKTFSYNLKTGQKLEDLATRYTFEVNKLRVSRGEGLRKDIEGVVFRLGMGEVSGPLKIDEKYYIFKLNNVIPPKQLNLPESQDRIYAFLFEKKMQEELTKWLDELKKQSYIKIL